MEDHIKELIAISASVASNCQPCLDFHIKKAREFGASKEDICIAVKISSYVKAGGAEKFMRRVSETLTDINKTDVSNICQCSQD